MLQAELDRYQDTVRLLKDYYKGMDGQIPDELNANYGRLRIEPKSDSQSDEQPRKKRR